MVINAISLTPRQCFTSTLTSRLHFNVSPQDQEYIMSTTMFRDRSPGSPFSGSDANDMNQILARNWWLIALRGFTGVIFGLCALILPFATLLALVLLFSAYMGASFAMSQIWLEERFFASRSR